MLADLAHLFCAHVGANDIVARYGGDEFLIVVEGGDKAGATELAQRLQHAVETYDPDLIHPKLGALHLGVSIGAACFPQDGDDCATLLSAADTQMYHQKTERKLGNLAGREKSADKAIELEASAISLQVTEWPELKAA